MSSWVLTGCRTLKLSYSVYSAVGWQSVRCSVEDCSADRTLQLGHRGGQGALAHQKERKRRGENLALHGIARGSGEDGARGHWAKAYEETKG